MSARRRRYQVVLLPVGWQVIDTERGEEVALYGSGSAGYADAKMHAERLNTEHAESMKKERKE